MYIFDIGIHVNDYTVLIQIDITVIAVHHSYRQPFRNFDIQAVTIAWWGGNGEASEIELRGSAVAYYSAAVEATTKTETIYANDANAKKGSK